MITTREATVEDAVNFAMRDEDIKEAWSILRADAKEVLIASYHRSTECYVAEINDNVVCMFGCTPDEEGAYFWLLFTNIDVLPMSFFRKAQGVIDGMLDRYGYLTSTVHENNKFILKLSKWAGFTIEKSKPYGLDQELFHRIYKRRLPNVSS